MRADLFFALLLADTAIHNKSAAIFADTAIHNAAIFNESAAIFKPASLVLLGGELERVALSKKSDYRDRGARCFDTNGNQISEQVSVEGDVVHTDTPGTFHIKYTCHDAHVMRTVVVGKMKYRIEQLSDNNMRVGQPPYLANMMQISQPSLSKCKHEYQHDASTNVKLCTAVACRQVLRMPHRAGAMWPGSDVACTSCG